MSKSQGFWGVICEANGIIRAYPFHFFALSLLFPIPLSLSAAIYPAIARQWLLVIVFNFISLCITVSALGTITYSAFNGFYGRSVTVIASIKSLRRSFLPLISTMILSQMIFAFIGAIFGIVLVLLSSKFSSINLWIFVVLVLPLLIWLQTEWALAYTIAAIESKWGFEALRRSTRLVKGSRRTTLSILLLYEIFSLAVAYGLWCLVKEVAEEGGKWRLMDVFQLLCSSYQLVFVMVYCYASNVVLYVYCKASHGEEVADECVSFLASDGDDANKVSDDVV